MDAREDIEVEVLALRHRASPVALQSRRRRRHCLEQPPHDLLGADALGVSMDVRMDPVAKHRIRDRLHVLDRDMGPAREDRAGLGSQDHVMRRAD